MATLAAVADDPDLGKGADVATDCAIASMAKIFIHVYNSGAAGPGVPPLPASIAQLMSRWVQYLPCDGDLIESQKIHEMLVHFIASNNPIVMGEGFRNLPIVLGIFAAIFSRSDWEEICLPETRQRMVQIMQQLSQAMPRDQLQSLLNAFTPEQMAALQPYFS